MTLDFVRGSEAWSAEIGGTKIFLPNDGIAPEDHQLRIATEIEGSLQSLRLKASAYLDQFVDRAKACGDGGEPWWLDEIEFRSGDPPNHYRINFQLTGDDGGLWSVEMLVNDREHRPIGIERRQG